MIAVALIRHDSQPHNSDKITWLSCGPRRIACASACTQFSRWASRIVLITLSSSFTSWHRRVCIRLHYFAPARWRHASPLRTGVLCVAGPAEQLGWRFGLWILLNSIWCWVQKMLQHRWTQCAAILKKVKKSRNGLPCACYSCVVGYTRLYAVPGIGKWAVLIDSDKTQRNCIKAITWWSNWEDI